MATLVGGTRTRMIRDSLRHCVVDGLEALGWFNSNRKHLPIRTVDRPNKWDDPIALNSLVISLEDRSDEESELGSNLSTDYWTAYIDFYAQSDDLGIDVAGDIRDILRGKMPSIGRDRMVLPCYDYRADPPVQFTTIDITDVFDDRARNFPHEWQTHWFVIRVDLEDEYQDEDDE